MVDDSLIGGKKVPPVLPGLFLFRFRKRSSRDALPGLLETLALEGASFMSISNPRGVCGGGEELSLRLLRLPGLGSGWDDGPLFFPRFLRLGGIVSV